MNIERLPNDILLLIFRYVDAYPEMAKLELVCRRWRKIMVDHGWKQIRQIELKHTRGIEPIGRRCGNNLVECKFSGMDIDTKLILLIAEHLPKLKHLDFRRCKLNELDESALEPFQEFAAHLRSLTFYRMDHRSQQNFHLLRHFTHLRHLGLHLSRSIYYLPNNFSADLRSLYFSNFTELGEMYAISNVIYNLDLLEQILTIAQRDCPSLAALYLDGAISNYPRQAHLLNRIFDLKNLRFLRIAFAGNFVESLCSCLNNLPQLIVLQLKMRIKHLSAVCRSLPFRELVHLDLSLSNYPSDVNLEPIGLLSAFAPKLRSLSLDMQSLDDEVGAHEVGSQVLKMVTRNNILEHLYLPCASFTNEELCQFVQLCPNLRTLGVRLQPNYLLPRKDELSRIVADQWHVGTRKHLPLEIWIYGRRTYGRRAQYVDPFFWQDPFLTIHIYEYVLPPPPNSVLDTLLRDEVFNNDNNDGGGTPSFVTELYSSGDLRRLGW